MAFPYSLQEPITLEVQTTKDLSHSDRTSPIIMTGGHGLGVDDLLQGYPYLKKVRHNHVTVRRGTNDTDKDEDKFDKDNIWIIVVGCFFLLIVLLGLLYRLRVLRSRRAGAG